MKKYCMVLLWSGKEPEDYVVQEVASVLCQYGVCVPELLSAIVKDQEDIADCIVSKVAAKSINAEEQLEGSDLEHAMVYISKKYENLLVGTKGNYMQFAIALSVDARNELDVAGFNPAGHRSPLLSAISILSADDVRITPQMSRKYHISKTVLDIIRKVNKLSLLCVI